MGPAFLGTKSFHVHTSPHLIPIHFQGTISRETESQRSQWPHVAQLGLFLCPWFQPSLYMAGGHRPRMISGSGDVEGPGTSCEGLIGKC